MALTHNVSPVRWTGADTIAVASGASPESDSFNVLTAPAAGVAIGLAIQISCLTSAHVRQDFIEILSSADGTTWDTTGFAYASNSIAPLTAVIQTLGTTIPLAYAENMRYFKVKITAPSVPGSSFTYTITVNKVTL